MYLFYSSVLALAALLSAPWWLLRMLRYGKYRAGLAERLGRLPERIELPSGASSIWVHAVSVGEVLAVARLVTALRARFPRYRVFVSTTTASGQALARERFGEENVFYFPLDFAFSVRPWLRALRPELIVLVETEFWPNLLRLAHLRGTRIAVVNARISDHSFPRYRRLRLVLRGILRNVSAFLAQSEEDRRRLVAIGGLPERVAVSGNLKFEVAPPQASVLTDQIRRQLTFSEQKPDQTPVVVCGSTVEGEESILVPAFRALFDRFPRALLILAPRHPERFASVAKLLTDSALPVSRRSQWNGTDPLPGRVLLLDTIGELASIYAVASVAFVGGSLMPRGGHNVLEPAQAGSAIVVGPHTENFRDIIYRFREANALRVVDRDDIASVLIKLLSNESERAAMGRRAKELIAAQSGATERSMATLEGLLASVAVPKSGLSLHSTEAR